MPCSKNSRAARLKSATTSPSEYPARRRDPASGSDVKAAAARELFEETGFAVPEAGLGPVVATSSSHWQAEESGKLYLGAHSFFFVRVTQTKLNTDGREDLERALITGHRWWSVADLRAATERITPLRLADLMDRLLRGDIPERPVRLPRRR